MISPLRVPKPVPSSSKNKGKSVGPSGLRLPSELTTPNKGSSKSQQRESTPTNGKKQKSAKSRETSVDGKKKKSIKNKDEPEKKKKSKK